MENPNPFVIFPLEVWEMILDRVYDSDTVYNLLQIFPELDLAFRKKKHEWLLGKILPFITTWTNLVEHHELLKCRLACKNFQQAVDKFLENQPQLRPYHPDLQSDDQFSWNSKTRFRRTRNWDFFRRIGGVKFDVDADRAEIYLLNRDRKKDKYKSAENFLEKMSDCPENRNPFLARCLSVKGWSNDQMSAALGAPVVDKVMEVLEKFGEHIWSYSIQLHASVYRRDEVWNCVTRCLDLLPNLKSLDLDVYFYASSNKDGWEIEGRVNLPLLESLRLRAGVPNAIASHLLSSITTPIRKLELKFGFWKDEYSRLLHTMTELELENISWRQNSIESARYQAFMMSLEAPQLVKLQLSTDIAVGENHLPVFIEYDVFAWLRRLPSLKYFDISNKNYNRKASFIQEKGTLLPERDSVPSLQSLSIRDSFALSYNFLLCLPSLQHLQIHTEAQPKVMDLSNERVVKIREQIDTGTMHRSNIWELLPNLRFVSIVRDYFSGELGCGREKYNYFKGHPDYQGFDDPQKDIGMRLRAEPNRSYLGQY